MNQRRIISLALALILAVVGTFLLVRYVRSVEDAAVADEELVDVYVVDKFVPKGADATAVQDAAVVEQIPARLVQDGAITDLDDLGDGVAVSDLQPGDQLLTSRVGAAEEVLADVEDKVQIAARFDVERAVGGALRPGDLVGVYLSFEPFDVERPEYIEPELRPDELPWYYDYVARRPTPSVPADEQTQTTSDDQGVDGTDDATTTETADAPTAAVPDVEEVQTPNVTRLEFQQVLVTGVQTVNAPVTATDDDSDSSTNDVTQVTGNQYVITLALSPEESERFVFAAEFGEVWLSNQPASVDDDGTRLVTLGNVYKVVSE